MTIKARSSGRAFMPSLGGGGADARANARRLAAGGSRGGARRDDGDAFGSRRSSGVASAVRRRAGSRDAARARRRPDPPTSRRTRPSLASGARVRHRQVRQRHDRRSSRAAAATPRSRIDFDDEAIGRKTLVVAQANLEREWD